jgi:hypothetical protein
MNCPSCGQQLPEEAGQHAVVPSAEVVDLEEIEEKEQS